MFGKKKSAVSSKVRREALRIVKLQYEALNNINRQTRAKETGTNEEDVLPFYKRKISIKEGRNLAENDLTVQSMLTDLETFVVGPDGGKPIFITDDEKWNKKAQKLTRRFIKDCDTRIPQTNITEWLKLALRSIFTDGDFALVVDPAITDGKFLTFEADQIAPINAEEWRFNAVELGYFQEYTAADGKTQKKPLVQHSGVITDDLGRVKYIVVSGKRGRSSLKMSEATIFSTEVARIAFAPKRFGQYRGNSLLIPFIQTLNDFRRLIEAEIQSAERIAKDSLAVKQKGRKEAMDAILGLEAEKLLEDIDDEDAVDTITQATKTATRYKTLEDDFGGRVAYLDADDELEHISTNRPNKGIAEFEGYLKQSIGKSIGLFKMFATGEVSTSYSAARAEILLTWVMIRCLQKFLERRVIDFGMTAKIREWVADGKLDRIPRDKDGDRMLPDETCTISWPKMPQIDPGAEIEAALARIKGGLSNFDMEMGPDRPAIWKRLAENVKELRESGLDILSVFETVAGASAGDKSKTPADKNQNND